MKLKQLSTAVAMSLALTPIAHAGEIVHYAEQAEQLLYDEKLYNGALGSLDQAMASLWAQMPLTLRTLRYVNFIEGYGRYQDRENDIFKPGEPLKIYAEIAGYVYGNNDGIRDMNIMLDFVLQDGDGNQLAAQDNFLNLKLVSLYENRETNLSINVELPEMAPGRYIGVYKFRDLNSDKHTSMIMPFHVAK